MSFDIRKTLLITDMDGTFLPASKIPGKRTLEAVERFMSLGGRFSIATGRAIQAANQYFDKVRVNAPIIMSNGGMVYDIGSKTQIYDIYLPQSARDITREIIDAHPWVGCEVLALEEVYVPQMTDMEAVHNEICKVTPVLCPVDEIPSKQWYKVLFALPPERMEELMSFVESKGYTGVDFVRSSKEYYEILPQNISKGSALDTMRKRCHMEDMLFIAAGDYNNDIELLQAADISVCPSNAVDDVKAVCSRVYPSSCEEDFIADVIEDIINGRLMPEKK